MTAHRCRAPKNRVAYHLASTGSTFVHTYSYVRKYVRSQMGEPNIWGK